MFFYIVCALFLLNAFTTEAQPQRHVKIKEERCSVSGPKHAGQCSSPDFAPIAHQFCAKTCGLC
ncbi:hypothetical protein OSTOST_14834 [Ostertagia ostertagi]